MIGLACLAVAFIFLIIWSLGKLYFTATWSWQSSIVCLVWMVAAQVTEKQKTIISRPNPLLFKRA